MPLNADWPTIDPGAFRHQIALLAAATDVLGVSGMKTTYAPADPAVAAWAKIEYVRGAELLKAGQDVSQVYVKVTSWYRREFAAGDRIQIANGSRFIIQTVENVKEMNTFMVLTCLGIGANS